MSTDTPFQTPLAETSDIDEVGSSSKVATKKISSANQAHKSAQCSITPLIRDVLKQDAKRKRVKSPQDLHCITCMPLMMLSPSSQLFFCGFLRQEIC